MDLHPEGEPEVGAALARGRALRLPARSIGRRDAEQFDIDRRRRKQLGQAAESQRMCLLREFVKTYWRLHAIPNLADSTRDFYARDARQPHRSATRRLRCSRTPARSVWPAFERALERDLGDRNGAQGNGDPTVDLVLRGRRGARQFNATARPYRKPRYERAKGAANAFCPTDVERIRGKLDEPARPHARRRACVLRGQVPEEVVCRLGVGRHRRARDPLPRHPSATASASRPLLPPLAEDLREWFLAVWAPPGRRAGVSSSRRRLLGQGRLVELAGSSVWKSRPERKYPPEGRGQDLQRNRWLCSRSTPAPGPSFQLRHAACL